MRSLCDRTAYFSGGCINSLLKSITFGLAALALAACGGLQSTTPEPASGWVVSTTPEPAFETYRLDLGSGVVVAFVEGLTPGLSGKVAYITHVPSGSQAVLDLDGKVINRHDGRADGRSRLDAILDDEAEMARITDVLTNGEDARPKGHAINWVPMVKFGGIDYLRRWYLVGQGTREEPRDVTAEDLGRELYRVAFRGDGYARSGYRYQDGDATFLNPGTPVYAVKGYTPEFRLGTLDDGRPTLYEADINPSAKTGGDLLDIRGRVMAIDIINDHTTILGTIDDEETIKRLVALMLEAPVNQRSRDHDGPHYFLGIRLADGTSVVRAFWLETGELSRGIMTDPVVTLSVWGEVPNEHRPVGTDGGPRISERLAARLGLAHLSFNVPELEVTGKPHSPTVRLMRRSEFDAMRGGSPGTRLPDPLVWVVEARGSWRTGGITPEEAREDLSVGLVAFDADTGSVYGASYRNEPLLERSDNHSDAPESKDGDSEVVATVEGKDVTSGDIGRQDGSTLKDALEPREGDTTVVATVQGKDVTRGDIRRWAEFWMMTDGSMTRDAAVEKSIVAVIDEFITAAEINRRVITPSREEVEEYMSLHRGNCMGDNGAECRAHIERLGFDPYSDEYWENIGLPEYGKALGEIKLFGTVVAERGMEDASQEDLGTLRGALGGELRENAVIVWYDKDLERTYQSALQSE